MIKVVRTGVTADGENIKNVFTVNHSRILNALKWLKQYNPLYKDIIVNESNLNWMTKSQNDTINHVRGSCKGRRLSHSSATFSFVYIGGITGGDVSNENFTQSSYGTG